MSQDPRRDDFEAASRPLLVWLSQRPRWLLLLAVLALLLGGLFLNNAFGGVLLLLLAAFLAWLLAIGWPAMAVPARWLRLAIVLVLAVLAGLRLVG